ncbi:hypothetical protein SE18_26635 [Herpetosiphon geysericola]|uniref:Uncharacterized protein n=1 Tax=Herpetosiphon geysericola TaxID=70996 RepID=A0A0P6XHE5_9CHLR|nr:hypothetical protein SE18_26635 [Herpetosiphon geysericola]
MVTAKNAKYTKGIWQTANNPQNTYLGVQGLKTPAFPSRGSMVNLALRLNKSSLKNAEWMQ